MPDRRYAVWVRVMGNPVMAVIPVAVGTTLEGHRYAWSPHYGVSGPYPGVGDDNSVIEQWVPTQVGAGVIGIKHLEG